MSERIQNVQPKQWNGRNYRSTLEAETAQTLDALGIPFRYEERKIVLQEGFRCPYQKEKVRDLTYCPDFEIGPIMLECKGFETPEWKIKKKLLFKWLMENEPDTIFYQIHDSKKSLLQILDRHLTYLNCCLEVTFKGSNRHPSEVKRYESISEALEDLNLKGKATGPILRSLTGQKQWVYGYSWKLIKLNTLL